MTDTLTFLGHASFKITRSSGEVLWIDPWLRQNPACPPEFHTLERADLVLITHGHEDHFDLEAVDQAAALGATIIAPAPIRNFLNARGVHSPRVAPMNKGGNVAVHGVRVNMTLAHHHAHIDTDGGPGWFHEAVGYVLDLGQTRIYFAGDTALFGDMRLIGELYHPTLAILPIGDVFTMGPVEAARAVEFLGVKQVVPFHYGDFFPTTGTPEAFKEQVNEQVKVHVLEPGQSLALE